MLTTRTNQEWIQTLTGQDAGQAEALEELRQYLLRAALFTLARSQGDLHGLHPEERLKLAEDCAQDSLLAVLAHLGEFRGESKFTTWVYKFGVNIALARARQERWRQVSLDALLEKDGEVDWLLWESSSMSTRAEQQAFQNEVCAVIGEIIRNDLTDRQRLVLRLLAFEDVPMDVLVERLGSSRNAIYKMLHDARFKVKHQLIARGYDLDEIFKIFQ
jgi:RNA polymerase sigma-70 factor (ECF subfamily)